MKRLSTLLLCFEPGSKDGIYSDRYKYAQQKQLFKANLVVAAVTAFLHRQENKLLENGNILEVHW